MAGHWEPLVRLATRYGVALPRTVAPGGQDSPVG
jgi:hypothetical protein